MVEMLADIDFCSDHIILQQIKADVNVFAMSQHNIHHKNRLVLIDLVHLFTYK